ncbi:hypothetical protein GYMLUDRAFT_56680 [Collybiopsis luxurians FD-317 M1]|nr:hypothetical protein GYMLUDRAFT_56680 [Collybiopsis luxurians FD-317 M1]
MAESSQSLPTSPLPGITPMFSDIWLLILHLEYFVFNYIFIISPSEEVVFQILETYIAWWSLGSGWGLLERIKIFPPEANPLPALIGIDISFTHAFYCWRIFILGKSYIIPVIISLISAAQLSLSIYVSAMILKVFETRQLLDEFTAAISAWNACSAAADSLITAAMVFFLLRERKNATYKHTIMRVETAIKYIIETGAITVIVMLVELAIFLALPDETYSYMVGKIYANALLANLNSRITFVTSGTAHLYQSNSDIQSTVNILWPTSHDDTMQRHQNPAAVTSNSPAQNVVLHTTAVLT